MRSIVSLLVWAVSSWALIGSSDSASCTNIEDIELAIQQIIDDTADNNGHRPFLAGFVRLSFHDCVGGCDGCINQALADNAGLARYISPLDQMYTENRANVATVMSRADLWALAGIVASKLAARVPVNCGRPVPGGGQASCEYLSESTVTMPTFTFQTGRQDCSVTSFTDAPNMLPDAHRDTEHAIQFFNETFGFTPRETVCIIGAHTLGEAHPRASGFRGPWVGPKSTLDNGFFRDLVNQNSDWQQINISPGNEPRYQWTRGGATQGGRLMLNTDIALLKHVTVDNTGLSNCTFSTCTEAISAQYVREFSNSNIAWVQCFSDTFQRMLNTVKNQSEPLEKCTVGETIAGASSTIQAASSSAGTAEQTSKSITPSTTISLPTSSPMTPPDVGGSGNRLQVIPWLIVAMISANLYYIYFDIRY